MGDERNTPCTFAAASKEVERFYDSAQKNGGNLEFMDEGQGTVKVILVKNGAPCAARGGIRKSFLGTILDGLGLNHQ